MRVDELASFIDLSILHPDVTSDDIERFIKRALKYPFASICVPPFYVPLASSILKDKNLKVSSVVGFPLGYQNASVKLLEAVEIVKAGGKELDVVMNISLFKSGESGLVGEEIEAIVSSNPGITVKVIIETCLLRDDEKIAVCKLLVNSGAHFVKTSTGFAAGGATVEDVRLLSENTEGRMKIKASGGINNLQQTLALIKAGASRIGTSSGITILEELAERDTSIKEKT